MVGWCQAMRLWNQALGSSGTGVCQAGDQFLGKDNRPGKVEDGSCLVSAGRQWHGQVGLDGIYSLMCCLSVPSCLRIKCGSESAVALNGPASVLIESKSQVIPFLHHDIA